MAVPDDYGRVNNNSLFINYVSVKNPGVEIVYF
jgi:hypothetical protein